MFVDSKRRLLNMLGGWEDNCDSLAANHPEHSDKYRHEAASASALYNMAWAGIADGDDLAVASFVADHVLPLLLEGK